LVIKGAKRPDLIVLKMGGAPLMVFGLLFFPIIEKIFAIMAKGACFVQASAGFPANF